MPNTSAPIPRPCGPADGRDCAGCLLLPRCSKRFPRISASAGRPCLNAHIGKCMAVRQQDQLRELQSGREKRGASDPVRQKDILKTLNERMLEASDRLEFETAALLRDQINAITKVTAGQKVVDRRWRWMWWRWPVPPAVSARRSCAPGGAADR